MGERVRVGISEFRVATAPAVLVTYGLGSCLGIAIYDPAGKVGGLAHALLPAAREKSADRPGRFVETSIPLVVAALVAAGAARGGLWAKLIGGANMFRGHSLPAEGSIGERNVRAARQALAALDIPLAGEEVGGCHGRSVNFDLQTGIVLVRCNRERGKILSL